MNKLRPYILAALVALIYALHQDFWNWKRVEPLVLGFLPIGLAYHAAYSMVVAGLMWVLVRWAWPAHLDRMEEPSGGDKQGKDNKA